MRAASQTKVRLTLLSERAENPRNQMLLRKTPTLQRNVGSRSSWLGFLVFDRFFRNGFLWGPTKDEFFFWNVLDFKTICLQCLPRPSAPDSFKALGCTTTNSCGTWQTATVNRKEYLIFEVKVLKSKCIDTHCDVMICTSAALETWSKSNISETIYFRFRPKGLAWWYFWCESWKKANLSCHDFCR